MLLNDRFCDRTASCYTEVSAIMTLKAIVQVREVG